MRTAGGFLLTANGFGPTCETIAWTDGRTGAQIVALRVVVSLSQKCYGTLLILLSPSVSQKQSVRVAQRSCFTSLS